MTKYLTSDTHFGHDNIIKYCDRPYADVWEMNRDMINKWNERVTILDEVYFLGDFCLKPKFYEVLPRLRFKKMYFIMGNHDRKSALKRVIAEQGLQIEICSKMDAEGFHLVHKPVFASDELPTLCGHVHEKWKTRKTGETIIEDRRGKIATKLLTKPVLNVGVDVNDFYPITFNQAAEDIAA
jgi:calcineurin-like phosphoesterase family protein